MAIYWKGLNAGFGNRLLGLSSILALSKCLESTFRFPWYNNSACRADFHELFNDMEGIIIDNSPVTNENTVIQSNNWDMIHIYHETNKVLKHNIDFETYCYYFISSLRSLNFKDEVLLKAKTYIEQDYDSKVAIHIRRTDRYLHHKTAMRNLIFTRNLASKYKSYPIMQEVGLIKSLQYYLFSEQRSSHIENKIILKLLDSLKNGSDSIMYSVYSDSVDELKNFLNVVSSKNLVQLKYYPGYLSQLKTPDSYHQFDNNDSIRESSIQDASVELIEMAFSKHIIQNIPSSSFSLCSSIIGKTPIISSKPRFNFWKIIKKTLGEEPYQISTENDDYLINRIQNLSFNDLID